MAVQEKEIVDVLKQSPEKGFRLLMAAYKEPVYWHIRRLVVSHADAQDVAQETFVRVFRHWEQYEGQYSLSAWIYRIATNEALRLLERRQQEQIPLEGADAQVDSLAADDYFDYTDLEAVRLQQAIHSLAPKQQATFNLRYYDELGYDEIAAITESTVAGAKMNYHLAKEKIIEYMNSHD